MSDFAEGGLGRAGLRLLLICTVALQACGRKQDAKPQADAAVPSAPQLTLADVAGTWDVRAWNAQGDSLPGFQLTATPDTAGWSMAFKNRPALPVHAEIVNGSLVARFGPYESVLRKGVTVTTTIGARLQDGHLLGTLLANYSNAGADSVLNGRVDGTRVSSGR